MDYYKKKKAKDTWRKLHLMTSPACLETIKAMLQIMDDDKTNEVTFDDLHKKLGVGKSTLWNRLNPITNSDQKDVLITKNEYSHKRRTFSLNMRNLSKILGYKIPQIEKLNKENMKLLDILMANTLLAVFVEDKKAFEAQGIKLDNLEDYANLRKLNLLFRKHESQKQEFLKSVA